MNKSAEAFRTIGEVADELGVPKHVLRFWEGRFPQIRPMKRGGGRRYYRPEDMELLRGIRALLHAEGYTIRGVQKILREHGVDQVKAAARRAVPVKAAAEAGSRKRGRKRISEAAAGGVNATQAAGARAQTASESAARFTLPPAPKARVLAALRELGVARAILLGQPIAPESLGSDSKKARASGP